MRFLGTVEEKGEEGEKKGRRRGGEGEEKGRRKGGAGEERPEGEEKGRRRGGEGGRRMIEFLKINNFPIFIDNIKEVVVFKLTEQRYKSFI